MEFPGVSPKPSLYQLSLYNFIIRKPINDIWELFIKYFEDRVDWKFNGRIMQCKTVCLLEIIHFDIIIFKYSDENESYIIEFRRMHGCRYGFSEFINDIETILNVNLNEKHTMTRCPPELPDDLYETHMEEQYNNIIHYIDKSMSIEERMIGYRLFGSIKLYYTKQDKTTDIINIESQPLLKIMKEAFSVCVCKFELDELRIIIVAALNTFIKFCNENLLNPSWMIDLKCCYTQLMNELNNEIPLLRFEIKKGYRLLN